MMFKETKQKGVVDLLVWIHGLSLSLSLSLSFSLFCEIMVKGLFGGYVYFVSGFDWWGE